MTPKSELEQHSLNDLWEVQREMRADIKRLEESVRVIAQEKLKPSSSLRELQVQIASLKSHNYDLMGMNGLLEDKLRDRSTDINRLLKENVALKIKLEETSGNT